MGRTPSLPAVRSARSMSYLPGRVARDAPGPRTRGGRRWMTWTADQAAGWTAAQVAGLAPDAAAVRAAQGLAGPARWLALGRDGPALWGACQGSGEQPWQTQVDLAEPAFRCTCPSRKLPCKHALALLLLLAEQ